MDGTAATTLRQVADKQAIANILAMHSRGIDRRDEAMVRSAYHEGATVAYGFFEGSAADFSRIVTQSTQGLPITSHRSHLPWIKADGDQAKSETYVIAYMELPLPGGATQCLIGGRYLDRLERRGGEWRLVHRIYVLDWNINQPSTVQWTEGLYGQVKARGGIGPEDPTHALFAGWLDRALPAAMASSVPSGADQQIADAVTRQALHDLVMAYSRGIDRCDEDLFSSIWHEGASVEYGVFDGDAHEFSRFIVPATRGLRRSAHCPSQERYEIRGDRAVGEVYVIAFATVPMESGDEDSLIGGRYIDRYERRDGIWKIVHRIFALDWVVNQPGTAIWDGELYGPLTLRGGRGAEDPIGAFWAD
jgi:hypothetical protein